MINVQALTEQQQLIEAVDLQRTVWGFNDLELLPVRLFVVANKVGGQVFGAYDGGRMVGFIVAIPGLKAGGKSYLHSHMLGVLEGYRDRGVGRMLKLKQREDAIARGIELIEWTFDPLELKNAFFNMQRLGAIVRRYVDNQYGTTTSPLHGGLPTDRCVAEWWISSPGVQHILAGNPADYTVEERIEVPADIDSIRRQEPRRAREIQKNLGDRLKSCFDRKLAVVGFERSPKTGVYLVGKY
jgi:predicted GNAT superfamily acetyltransferase